jgi:hypothetical protein
MPTENWMPDLSIYIDAVEDKGLREYLDSYSEKFLALDSNDEGFYNRCREILVSMRLNLVDYINVSLSQQNRVFYSPIVACIVGDMESALANFITKRLKRDGNDLNRGRLFTYCHEVERFTIGDKPIYMHTIPVRQEQIVTITTDTSIHGEGEFKYRLRVQMPDGIAHDSVYTQSQQSICSAMKFIADRDGDIVIEASKSDGVMTFFERFLSVEKR